MSEDENKSELFSMIADSVVNDFKQDDCTVVATKKEEVLPNRDIVISNISPCNKEEADDRIFLHVLELS